METEEECMASESDNGTSTAGESSRSSTSSPLVFISHDTRDAELAEAFSKLLSSVSAGLLKSFRSSDRRGTQGIEYGHQWFPEIMAKLTDASDVVCLLTPRSVNRPWILYEAGVAKGKLETPVHGVALGIPLGEASRGPFAQFQNSDDDEDSLTKLVMQLLRRIPGAEPDPEVIRVQVRAFKEKADEVLSRLEEALPEGAAGETLNESSIAKIFEEIKVMFHDLPTRLDRKLSDQGDSVHRRRLRRFHPMMIDEMSMMAGGEEDPALPLLIISSLLRDDVPWLYEIGMDAYRHAQKGAWDEAGKAMKRLHRAAKATMRGPWFEEMGYGGREAHMLLRELPMILDHARHRMMRHRSDEPCEAEEDE